MPIGTASVNSSPIDVVVLLNCVAALLVWNATSGVAMPMWPPTMRGCAGAADGGGVVGAATVPSPGAGGGAVCADTRAGNKAMLSPMTARKRSLDFASLLVLLDTTCFAAIGPLFR